MKNACTFLAVASLLLATSLGRSQDAEMVPRPADLGVPTRALATTQPDPAKCLTLQQRMQEWGKLQPVSQTVAAPVEPAAPPLSFDSVPTSTAVPAMSPETPPGISCLAGPGHRCCWEQLDGWLTYRPLSRDCCGCLLTCVHCCPPPLYTFFIGSCCVNPTGAGCGAPCARDGSCGGGHRLAGLWDGMRNCRFWPGRGNFHIWNGWDDFLFYHDKSSAQGNSTRAKEVTEMETR